MTEWEGLLRISVAALVGGAIGFERETLDKAAGLRTHMLVSMGAALFMVIAILLTNDFGVDPQQARAVDPSRIASTIVTGIGFLGGGIIFRAEGRVKGLTTAAGLWVAAAIGMAAGAGYYATAVGGTALTLVILYVLRHFERVIPSQLERSSRVPDD